MSSNRGRRNFRGNNRGNNKRENVESIDDASANNPVIKQFLIYREMLDLKHDKHERLVKLSRDITIESKRIIFLLHTIDDVRKNNKETVLEEAKTRIDKLCSVNFSEIAKELNGCDQYQFMRAFSAGIQEFIEAYTFYEFMQGSELSDWQQVQERFKYSDETGEFSLNLVPIEFMLGLADLTGEIMRTSINSLGSGDTDNCFKTCKFLQNIFAKYLGLNSIPNRGRDFSQKMTTMRSSCQKVENVCYNLVVRGTEGAKLTPLESLSGGCGDDDEGFF